MFVFDGLHPNRSYSVKDWAELQRSRFEEALCGLDEIISAHHSDEPGYIDNIYEDFATHKTLSFKVWFEYYVAYDLIQTHYSDGTLMPHDAIMSDVKRCLSVDIDTYKRNKPLDDNELMEFLSSFPIVEGAVS